MIVVVMVAVSVGVVVVAVVVGVYVVFWFLFETFARRNNGGHLLTDECVFLQDTCFKTDQVFSQLKSFGAKTLLTLNNILMKTS